MIGKPDLLDDWNPKGVYAGVPVEMPTVDEETDRIQQLIDMNIDVK